MKPRHLLTTILTLYGSAAAIAQKPDSAPSRFSASIDNFGDHTYTVELREGALLYSDVVPQKTSEPIKITPTLEQWREFRHALDANRVWSWQDHYMPNPPIFDGTGWSFSIRYPDRSLVTGGGNCYPESDGSPSGVPLQTSAFIRLEAAVEALLGGKPFRSTQREAHR